MAKFVSINKVVNLDTDKTERVYMNIDLLLSVKRYEKYWILKFVNGDNYHVLELPTFLSESIFPPQ